MIGFFVLLILVISAPLVTARFFSDFIMFLSKIVWRKRDSISYLSIHNMRKYRISISKLVSLLMIGSMLSIMAITIPPTFEAHNTESAIYSVGAEMRIDANISDPAVISLLQDNRVIAFTEIVYGVISVIDTPSYEDIGRYNIMGINPNTFVKAAYWQDDYDDTTLADIVNSIDDGNNDSIALESVYHEKMTTGGEFVNLSLSSALTDFQFRVKSSYDMFPNLVMRKPRFDPWMNSYYLHQTSILTRIDIAKRLLNMDIPEIHSTYHTGFYLDLVDGIDIDEFKSEIEQVVGEGTVSMPEMEEGGVPLIFNNVLFSLFHALIITFLIVSFTAFSYYSYISMIERKKEIGIYRALGMVHKQIFKIYLIENIIIFLSGIVIGSITGLLLNEIVFMIYKGMEGNASVTIPPIRRVIPYDIIAIFYGLIILINLIPVILPPKILSRQQVGDILRLD
jgi:ABC-type antimicrobial peptide transport system permease subunit